MCFILLTCAAEIQVAYETSPQVLPDEAYPIPVVSNSVPVLAWAETVSA